MASVVIGIIAVVLIALTSLAIWGLKDLV